MFTWSAAPCILPLTEPYDLMCELMMNCGNNVEGFEGLFEYDMSGSYDASTDTFINADMY